MTKVSCDCLTPHAQHRAVLPGDVRKQLKGCLHVRVSGSMMLESFAHEHHREVKIAASWVVSFVQVHRVMLCPPNKQH